MAEQRDPGWFWVRANPAGAFFVSNFNGENFWLGMPGGREPAEIGPRIPEPDELKALWAVAEAARRVRDDFDMFDSVESDRREALHDALARLGERK